MEIIEKIKAKKPLDRLDDSFVAEFLEDFLKKNNKLNKKLLENKLKKKDFELIVKSVRNELNKIYGQFWINDKLDLLSHKSAKERLNIYKRVYKNIFIRIGKPKTVLDLGCGLNPLSYKFIGKNVYFTAVELTDYDCERLKEYFKKNNIKGEVIKADIRTYNKFPNTDVCFMFKILDSLENKGHFIAENLIKNIKAKYIIASFSTYNIRGRRMNYPKRGWFEMMLKRLGYKFMKFEDVNEIFYIVNKD